MKIKVLGANRTELVMDDVVVFFSYATPVAAHHSGKYYRTSRWWSSTTTRHINRWLDGREAEVRPQEFFGNLVK